MSTLCCEGEFISHGANPDRCHVIYPAVDAGRLNGADPEIRARLGLARTDLVLFAAGESFRDASHTSALWAAGNIELFESEISPADLGARADGRIHERFARLLRLITRLSRRSRRLAVKLISSKLFLPRIWFCSVRELLHRFFRWASAWRRACRSWHQSRRKRGSFSEDDVNALVEPSVNPRRLAQRVRDLQNDPSLRKIVPSRAFRRGRPDSPSQGFARNGERCIRAMNGKDASADGFSIHLLKTRKNNFLLVSCRNPVILWFYERLMNSLVEAKFIR